MLGDVKFGEAISMPWEDVGETSWMLPCAFAQSDLLRVAHNLSKGKLYVPGVASPREIPLRAAKELGELGPDVRDIHDGFSLARSVTAYPALWNHDASFVTTLALTSNQYLSPLHRAKEGRHLRKVDLLWPKAGRVLLAERLWLNTQRLVAVRTEKPVLSNVWWPVRLLEQDDDYEKALILWLNSTPGLLLLLTRREETRGAWVKFRKPVLSEMPVLDVGALTVDQLNRLVDAYDALSNKPLLPFPKMASDPVREALDTAVSSALALPDLSVLRKLLAQEPVISLRPISQ